MHSVPASVISLGCASQTGSHWGPDFCILPARVGPHAATPQAPCHSTTRQWCFRLLEFSPCFQSMKAIWLSFMDVTQLGG